MPSNNWKWRIERGGNQCWWECATLRVCFLVVSCAKCFTNMYWDIFPHWVLKRQTKTIMISILHRGTKGLAERLGELPRSMKKVWNMDRISSPMPQPWYFFLSSNALFIIIRLRSLSPASKPQERFHCECLLFQWKNCLISGFEIESKCCLMDFVLGGFSHFPHAVCLWLLLWDACRVLFGIKKKGKKKYQRGLNLMISKTQRDIWLFLNVFNGKETTSYMKSQILETLGQNSESCNLFWRGLELRDVYKGRSCRPARSSALSQRSWCLQLNYY